MLYMHLSLLHITKNLKMVYTCDAIFWETVPYYIILIIITLIYICAAWQIMYSTSTCTCDMGQDPI